MTYIITRSNFQTDEAYKKTRKRLSNLLYLYNEQQIADKKWFLQLTEDELEELVDLSIIKILELFKKFEFIAWETLTNLIKWIMTSYYRKTSKTVFSTSLEDLTTNEEGDEVYNSYLVNEDEEQLVKVKIEVNLLKEKVFKTLSQRHLTLLTLLENWKNRGQCKAILKCSYETINKMLAEIKEIY